MLVIREEDYAQKASAVLSIRAILEGYPLSVGILREILQNSDDAGAKKQTFVLDQRSHATGGLFKEGLASTQGPAFMAYNDAVLGTQDWEALCSMHDSSKTADESKIGKYGVGFRSVFNLTDSPQILSDQYLAIFDPLCHYLESEGRKVHLGDVSSIFPNQLLPFGFFMKDDEDLPFLGTIIRCPFRTAPSMISDQVVDSEVISKLFKEFMDQEMEISCLFLSNINCIEIHEIAPTGVSTLLAKMDISRSNLVSPTMVTATVQLDRNKDIQRKEWHIVQSDFSRDEAISMLLEQPGYHSTIDSMLQGDKFSPEVKIAVDITRITRGRLFSFLPLPIFTGFPVHIHASFGIDSSRTNLRRDSVGLASGSRDHTKVQWNTMLFQTFIPRTWGYLLKELVSRGLVSKIFDFWPPETSSGELESYTSSLSGQLVNALLAAKAEVWPVYEPQNQSTEFRSLESLVIASPHERENVLQALTRVGVSLTWPPKYIFDRLVSESSLKNRILTPEVAHGLLLKKVDKITQVNERDQKSNLPNIGHTAILLLEYLLSTDNVFHICGLPLIPIANGEKVTVSNAQGDPTFTILTLSEFKIFGRCDDLAISLNQLPPRVASILFKSGPNTINVQRLSVPCIVEYLSTYTNRLGMDSGAVRCQWLSGFWEWMGVYEHKDKLFPQIRNFFLLPSTNGLQKAESPLFKLRSEHPAYTSGYIAIGVPFLDKRFSDTAHGVLEGYDLVTSIWNIRALLDSLASTSPTRISQPDCESILKHLVSQLDESIDQERMQRLRSLPIFPVLTYTTTGVVTNWTAIPQGHKVRSLGRPKFVPFIKGISFVGLNHIAPGMVKFLDPSHPTSMSDNDLVELAVENFTTQPEHIQLTILRLVTDSQNRIFPVVIDKLRSQAFVLADDGGSHFPGDIVDPDSDIGPLYIGCPEYRPSIVHPFCREILQCLKKLALLRARLTPDIAAERIEYISSRHTSDEALLIARNLLLILWSSNIDFSRVQGISEKKWLPTNQGLCSAGECRHPAVIPSVLFDKVLAVLTILGRSTISPSFRSALGWDKPLPIKLLIEQLNGFLNSEHNYDAVVEIFKEFGRRQWSDEDIEFLEKTVRNRQWIPTTGDMLADIKSSVFKFSPTMINSGFYQVSPILRAEKLLRRMGCTDHPSTRAILDKLHTLDQDSNSVDVVGTSISLLKSLPEVITIMEGVKLLIPDKDSRLRPVSKVFYNDIGENYCLMSSDGHFIAHQLVDESLARKLGLDRLGLRHADLRNIGPNMGQAPITTVRRTLQQYTNKQFLPEFLANAADAKATEFKVAINLTTVNEERNLRVLTSNMAYLCKLPSLVVYNNERFTSQDFEGICHTSLGGKEGRPDTIGEFGQGVLTMYHFTDLAMVISGSRVLFLDPSKNHLPFPDRASLELELQRVQKFFKDHLIALDGLFDFDMSTPTYNGTLFVLPLRVCDSPHTPVVPDFWHPERIISEILEPFKTLAGDCMLFTDIQTISCFTRAEAAVLQWSFCAKKEKKILETGYAVTDIKITKPTNCVAHWKTVTTSRSRDQLPLEIQKATRFRRSSFAGLAARLDRASDGHSFNFFSVLPLSSPTTLPMHVMASFKLSSDRRQIRLDSYEKLETRYNTWLLEELIPPLYLFFLEHLLISGDEHYRLRWPTNKDNRLSNLVVKSFYSSKHLASSPRRLFSSLYSPSLLSPQNAVLQANDPRSIRLILSLLKPDRVVDLPSGPRELAATAGVPAMVPNFVKNEILRNPKAITSDIDFQLILDVIQYLTEKDTPDIICDLPILPLEDGTFGTLAIRGTGTPYYQWKPKDPARMHNFFERCFVHPEMKTQELMNFRLNVFRLDASTIKGFVEAKVSTFPGPGISQAQLQWTDSFWDSWGEYARLGLIHDDIASFPLVPTMLSSSLVCLEQCKNGDVLLVGGDSQERHGLRSCLRELGLPLVHIDGPIPGALRKILEKDAFPRLNLQSVLSAITRTGALVPDIFHSLSDDLRVVFANWARANVSQISEDQIPLAQSLPIWWSAGGGTRPALRPSSEVHLLPEKLTLQHAAIFMADCVAEDVSLTHLHKRHMTFNELPHRLHLPDVLDEPTLLQYKQFYNSWITHLPSSNLLSGSQGCRPLLVPTSAYTFRSPQDLFKRGPLFTAVFPEDSAFFVHAEFEEYEEMLCNFGLKTEEGLDVGVFTTCAESLANDLDDPNAVPRAREVFRAYSHILPRRIDAQDHDAWRELDDLAFIPRRIDTVRKFPDQSEDASGLEIPMAVTQLPAILSPAEFVRQEFEAVAWSQRACFEEQPSPRACLDYPTLGKPSFSEVLTHLRYLSKPNLSMRVSQRQILFHDLKEVYQYFITNLDLLRQNEELAQTTLFALRDERLFLNIDDEADQLNWVQGSSLAFDCNVREGPVQDVRNFLRPFETILIAAGALKVQHPSYSPEHATQQSESVKLQNIWSSFNQLRKEKAFIDVEFVHVAGVPYPEPLFAHRVFLAASGEYFKDYFRGDFIESRNASPNGLHTLEVEYSWQCVQSFLDYIYTGNKGENFPVELLLEILYLSNYYHVRDLFDEVQGEILRRRLLRPETLDKVKAAAEELQTECLLNACIKYESENAEFIRRSYYSVTA